MEFEDRRFKLFHSGEGFRRGFLRVYLAGKMEWQNEEDSCWTCVVSPRLRSELEARLPAEVEIVYPDDTGFDHGGDIVKGIVAEDLALLGSCDAVAAVFSEPDQTGTVVEFLNALHSGKECLAVFTQKAAGMLDEGPPKQLQSVFMRGESDPYWFLINYLRGDSSHNVIFQGFQNVSCFYSPPDRIPYLIVSWVLGLLTAKNASRVNNHEF